MRLFSFSFLIGSGAALGHLYLYLRLLRHLAPGRASRRAIVALLVAMTLLLMFRGRVRDLFPDLAQTFAVLSYTWIALGLCTVIVLAVVDVTRLALALKQKLLARTALAPVIDEGRRLFLSQAAHWGVVAGGGLTAGYGGWRAFTPPEVTELSLKVPRLPKSLDGITLVQLTDIHVGPLIGRRFIDQLVHEANALKPDLVAITGDLVDGSVDLLGDAVAGLANLRARYGTFFVPGNHDYYSGDVAWTRFLEELGLTVLRNRRVEIGDEGGTFDLVGVDDWSGGRRRGRPGYDLERAIAGRDPERAAVLLAHQPANFEGAAARGIDVQISGHTHGGQLFPMTMLVGLRWPHVAGLYRHDDAHLYVSRGCGFWGPPARVGSPPEILKLTLTT